MNFLYNNFLSDLFVQALNGMTSLVAQYAISIIILTILIRLALLPLDIKQRGNQRKMAALGPQLQSLQKRYANDPAQIQKKQQELYRKAHVNPMLGCLPALIQLPILFAFFGAMRVLASEQVVQLVLEASHNGADAAQLTNFLWVENLWQPDTLFANILPSYSEFASFIQTNATYISPQTLSILRLQGMISYSGGMLQGTTSYVDLTNQILATKGLVAESGAALANGYCILPALAGLSLFFQQKFGAASMSPQLDAEGNAMAQPGGKFMQIFFPLFSVYICFTSNAAFALYWTISSAYAFAQMRVVTAIIKRRTDKKVITVKAAK